MQVSRWRKRLQDVPRYRERMLVAARRAAELAAAANHRGEGTGLDEWFTPPEYVDCERPGPRTNAQVISHGKKRARGELPVGNSSQPEEGQQAMALAFLRPEPERGRGNIDAAKKDAEAASFSYRRLQEARQVLHAAPDDLALQVLAGSLSIDAALAEIDKRICDVVAR